MSSPSASELRLRADSRQMAKPRTKNGNAWEMASKFAPPTPPICHDRTLPAMSPRGRITAVTNDASAAEVAAPARASLRGVAPPRPSDPIV